MDLVDELRSLEEALMSQPSRSDRGFLESVLSEGFREFSSSGRVYSRKQVIDAMVRSISFRFRIEEFRAQMHVTGLALVTYRLTQIIEDSDGELVEQKNSLRSSIWMREGSLWQLHFHQGTEIPS